MMGNILNLKKMTSVLSLATALCMSPTVAFGADINIIPVPVKLDKQNGEFTLPKNTVISFNTTEGKAIGDFFAGRIKASTGYDVKVLGKKGTINIVINKSLKMNDEGYFLDVTSKGVTVKAKTAKGAFYGMESFMQLLPAEIESPTVVKNVKWVAQNCSVEDYPRFGYRGFMLDPCRHFISVENVKKQIDLLAMFKVNVMHFHLTEDQGWRIEIKKYPKLTSLGSKRTEGEGTVHEGFYTQEQIKDIVRYAAQRFITVIPELEIPGHEMAAISAYPELSCKGEQNTPRIVWGVEEIVMCPGKEKVFEFLEDIVKEMVPLFPSKYFHIGGDECPKVSWKNCPTCQQRIKDEHLEGDDQHTAEEKLQSYVIKRMEKVLAKYGKKIIGWDEILEGGLSPQATVMSWRGEEGGIAAALQQHDVIMTPGGNGMYLDAYQGDYRVEPVTIGGKTLLSKTYSYDPVPDTLRKAGLDKHILGVQCNNWSEYMYDNEKMEYQMYPRAVAVAEVGWSPLARKDFNDFSKRLDANLLRLEEHNITYHIPMPEQPDGSINKVVFVDNEATIAFETSRPTKMYYTLDGTEPTLSSKEYKSPIKVSGNTVIKIASASATGKLSKVRTINVEKSNYAPATAVEAPKCGLALNRAKGYYHNVAELAGAEGKWETSVINHLKEMLIPQKDDAAVLRGAGAYASVAEGYLYVPEDGVYTISTLTDQLWIDNKLVIDNDADVKRFSHNDTQLALAKGLHPVKIVFIANIKGGWPSWWNGIGIKMGKNGVKSLQNVSDTQLFHASIKGN